VCGDADYKKCTKPVQFSSVQFSSVAFHMLQLVSVQKMRYVDRAEVDSSDETDYSSLLAWPGFAKSRQQATTAAGKQSAQSPGSDEAPEEPARSARSKCESPAGLYDTPPSDSPSTGAPGPYDSPASDVEREEDSTSEQKVRTRFVG